MEYVHEDYRTKVDTTLKEALANHQDAQVDFVFRNGNWVKCHVRWWPRGLVGASEIILESIIRTKDPNRL